MRRKRTSPMWISHWAHRSCIWPPRPSTLYSCFSLMTQIFLIKNSWILTEKHCWNAFWNMEILDDYYCRKKPKIGEIFGIIAVFYKEKKWIFSLKKKRVFSLKKIGYFLKKKSSFFWRKNFDFFSVFGIFDFLLIFWRNIKLNLQIKEVFLEIYNVSTIYKDAQRLKLELKEINYQTTDSLSKRN